MWMQDKKAALSNQRSAISRKIKLSTICLLLIAVGCQLSAPFAFAEELNLQSLINEALKNNPDILAAESRANASRFRIPQAKSLPDPMFMFGYQNEGWRRYTYGEMQGAQWMYSVSQMFPFPGKLSLKGEMASRDSESLKASYGASKLRTIARVRKLYYELFLAYKNIDLIKDRTILFSRIEDAAISRYSTGMGSQQEILMAQTENICYSKKRRCSSKKFNPVKPI